MRKVFTLQESGKGLVYPIEQPDNQCSMPFYIEESENGELDEKYEMEISFYKGKGEHKTDTLPMRKVKKTKRIFEIHYKDTWTRLRASLAKENYVGSLESPKEPLWMLSFSKKEWENGLEEMYDKHHIILTGYQPRKDRIMALSI